MLKILGKKFPNDSFPPVIVHILYLLTSITFCLFYSHLVIGKTDFHTSEYGGIYRVLEGNAIKALQFRVLVPLIFKAFTYLHIPDLVIFMTIIIIFTYFTVLFFYFILNIYFLDKTGNCFVALVLFYPMAWNFMLLNQNFLFMDNSLLFFLTSGLYFILTRRNNWLLVNTIIGTLNHPSIIMLIPAYMLFNYNRLLKKDTVVYSILLIVSYLACSYILERIYPNFSPERGVNIFATFFADTVEEIRNLPFHMLIRDIVLKFGGLHIFAALFLISGVWKKIKRQYVYIYLIIIPYLIAVVLRAGIRIEEMRNWIPLIPFIMIPALLYLSQIKNPLLKLSDEVSREPVP